VRNKPKNTHRLRIWAIQPVGNLPPAGRWWPSKTFYAACHMIWKVASARGAKHFSNWGTMIFIYIYIYIHYLSVRANNRQIYFNETNKNVVDAGLQH
jgi:hypothetical protein